MLDLKEAFRLVEQHLARTVQYADVKEEILLEAWNALKPIFWDEIEEIENTTIKLTDESEHDWSSLECPKCLFSPCICPQIEKCVNEMMIEAKTILVLQGIPLRALFEKFVRKAILLPIPEEEQ